MKYYFIAGEASGDLHGANCMRELKRLDPQALFRFTGGARMEEEAGAAPDIHIRHMAFMGFVDVLRHIRQISRNFRTVKKKILEFKPDLLLLIDYPGFNLRMAKWATGHHFRVDYYISPTVWAWKENRVEKVRRFTHRMLAILPFEEIFYKERGHQVFFTGHPLLDEIERKRPSLLSCEAFRNKWKLGGKPIIAILPGSRQQEIARMQGVMIAVARDFPDHQLVVAASSAIDKALYLQAEAAGVRIVYDQTYELMRCAVAGVIKSGTSTLECALMELPQVVCYKGGNLSVAIGRRLVKVRFISLVNLILDREAVKELIQGDMTAVNISAELKKLVYDAPYRERILEDYKKLREVLGGGGASLRAAQYIYDDAKAI